MRKIFLIILISLFLTPLFAKGSIFISDEKTFGIFPSFYYVEHGWFIGPVAQVTTIAENMAFSLGGRIGWMGNRRYVVGLGYYSQLTKIEIQTNKTVMNYGGLELEYIFFPDELIHFSVYSLLGYGGLKCGKYDHFFMVEPGAHVVLSMTDIFHIEFGISKRFVKDVDSDFVDFSDLNNYSWRAGFKLGNL